MRPSYCQKFVETYEGIDIYEVKYESIYGEKVVFSVGEGGVDDILDLLDMSYGEAIDLAKKHGCTTEREYLNGRTSAPHMDFQTLEGMKNMIDVGKSARMMENIMGNFTEEEMDEKIERLKHGFSF